MEVRATEAERLFLPHLQLPGALPAPSGILGVVVRLAGTTTPRNVLGAGKDPGSRVDSRKGHLALSISIKHWLPSAKGRQAEIHQAQSLGWGAEGGKGGESPHYRSPDRLGTDRMASSIGETPPLPQK